MIVANGTAPDPALVADVDDADVVVACDGGVDAARDLGLRITHGIGDFDSATPGAVAEAEHHGAEFIRFSSDKDQSDLELALEFVRERYPRRAVVLVGADGGRLDHRLANWSVLAGHAQRSGTSTTVRTDSATAFVVTGSISLPCVPGDLVSLHPWGGPCGGVEISPARWPLDGVDLSPFEARGLSNECVSDSVTVTVQTGVCFVVMPTSGATRSGHR